jgi:Ca2+-binding EF-hand superfamily protein/tetrahydromethanopterin S-methyltransferase subunit G
MWTLQCIQSQALHAGSGGARVDGMCGVVLTHLSGCGCDGHHQQAKPYRDELRGLKEATAQLDTALAEKQELLTKDTASYNDVKARLEELDEWQHTLVGSMKKWEGDLDKMNNEADQDHKSVWKKKEGIAKAAAKIELGKNSMQRKQSTIRDKQQAIDSTVKEIIELHAKIQVQKAAVVESKDKLDQMQQKLQNTKSTLEQEKADAVDRGRVDTPRPDWEETKSYLSKIYPDLDIDKTSKEIVEDLTKVVVELRAQTIEARQDAKAHELAKENEDAEMEERQQKIAAADKKASTSKFLVCQGKGPGVPVYLRATGKVPNLNFSRNKVVSFLREFWSAKGKSDSTRSADPADFLSNFLKQKFGTSRKKIENSYNIIYGVTRYSFDADCEIFSSILEGNLPSDAFFGQQSMVAGLAAALKKSDSENHGGRMWNTLDRTEFGDVLKKYFPLKSDEDLKALRRALSRDQPLPDIRYLLLFKDDDAGLPSKFLETVRDQYCNDVQQAFPRLEAAIRRTTLEDAESKQVMHQIKDSELFVGSEYYKVVRNIALFSKEIADKELLEIIQEMDVLEYHDGDVIIQEGTVAQHAFVLMEGGAYVVKEGAKNLNTNYNYGDFFGELALMHEDVRAASVLARASRKGSCRCLRMHKNTFDKIKVDEERAQELLQKRQMAYYYATKMAMAGHGGGGGGAAPASPRAGGASPRDGKELSGVVTSIAAVRTAFTKYFDKQMPRSEVQRLINLGRGRAEDEPLTAAEEDELVSLSEFMANVRKTVIKRYAKAEELSEAEKRADFLRNVSDSERAAITQCFEELDESGDGCLDLEELGVLMRRIYGFEPTAKQLQQLMIEIDTDGNGVIDIDEFISAMATVKEVRVAGEIFKWRQCFDKYDTDKSGELSPSELFQLVDELFAGNLGDSAEMIQFMVDEADVDGSGEINWWEFCLMMQKMMDEEAREIEQKRQRMVIETRDAASAKSGAKKLMKSRSFIGELGKTLKSAPQISAGNGGEEAAAQAATPRRSDEARDSAGDADRGTYTHLPTGADRMAPEAT